MKHLAASLRIVAVAAALALGGCATGYVPPVGEETVDLAGEQLMLQQAAAEEAQLDSSGFVLSLPETEAYLQHIATRLCGDDAALAARVRVRIVQDPTLNAFALPSGALYLHTGLLARLDNEAQIATIIAHEISHIKARHALRRYRQTKASLTVFNVIAVGSGGYGSLLGGIGAMAAVSGYSRELEREADTAGFQRLLAAGYDLHATTQVFDVLQFESHRSQRKEPFFFGSHPRLAERRESFGNLLVKYGVPDEPGTLGEIAYHRHLPTILHYDIEAALRTGDFEGADQLLVRLETMASEAAETAYLRGEWYRRRPAADAITAAEAAVTHYRRALVLDHEHAAALRGLGLCLGHLGREREAAVALHRYLDLAPLANDRAHMLELINTWTHDS